MPDKACPYFCNGGHAWYSDIPDPTDDLDCGVMLHLVDSRVTANELAWRTFAQAWGYTGGHFRKWSKLREGIG